MMSRVSPFQVSLLLTTLLAVVCALISLSCSHGSGWVNPVDWQEIDTHNLPGVKEYPEAGAVILLDEGSMEMMGTEDLGISVFERHRIVRVLTAAGQRYANVVIPYGRGAEIENIQARTIAPDGTISPVKETDIYDASLYPNYIFFSDQRAKLFTLPAVRSGSVLEYRYRMKMNGHSLWHSWSFQDQVPTLVSRFTLISPAEYPVIWKLYGISITPRESKMPAGFKQTTIWEAHDVDPLQNEFGMPSERELEARLAIAPRGFRSWDDVGKWYDGLAEPRTEAGPAIKALVERITAGAADDHTKLQRLYEWVQEQVRYIAVEIGIGGYQPHAAEEVCSRLYGDCKDMTTLLCAMARQVGIDTRPALVSTWRNGRPDTSLATPLQFNHAIAFAPSVDGGVWMDATEKWCRFGTLPWYDQGLPVLVIEKGGKGRIVSTPRDSASWNYSRDEWNIHLDSAGAGIVRGESWFTGMPAIEHRNDICDLGPSDQRRWLEVYLARRCPGVVLDSMMILGMRPGDEGLRLRYTFRTSMFAVRRGSSLLIQPGWVTGLELAEYLRSTSRHYPVRFRFGMHNEVSLAVTLPPGWGVVNPEISDAFYSAYGSVNWTCVALGSVLRLRSGYSFMGDEIPASKYGEFQQYLDAIQIRDMRVIEVGQKTEDAGKITTRAESK
jgi:transglutaminase-like putative cysteine protease